MVNIRDGFIDSVTFASYIINSPNTNYIAFEVSPNREIKYDSIVRIDVIDGDMIYQIENQKK